MIPSPCLHVCPSPAVSTPYSSVVVVLLFFLCITQCTCPSRTTSGFNRQHRLEESTKNCIIIIQALMCTSLAGSRDSLVNGGCYRRPSKLQPTHLDKVQYFHHMHSSQERFPSCSLEVPRGLWTLGQTITRRRGLSSLHTVTRTSVVVVAVDYWG